MLVCSTQIRSTVHNPPLCRAGGAGLLPWSGMASRRRQAEHPAAPRQSVPVPPRPATAQRGIRLPQKTLNNSVTYSKAAGIERAPRSARGRLSKGSDLAATPSHRPPGAPGSLPHRLCSSSSATQLRKPGRQNCLPPAGRVSAELGGAGGWVLPRGRRGTPVRPGGAPCQL